MENERQRRAEGENMNYIRVKSNIKENCIRDRLQYNPEIVELHLVLEDIEPGSALLPTIRLLKDHGCTVYLHQPPKVNGVFWDLLSSDSSFREAYKQTARRLAEVCREADVRSVIHAHYKAPPQDPMHEVTQANTRRMRDLIEEVVEFAGDRFLWEDTTAGLFSYANPMLLDEVVKPLGMPLNVDVSHAFIALGGDNAKLRTVLEQTAPFAQYYHLVDSMGERHDSLPLGDGKIDWTMVAPFVKDKDFIFEINLPGDHSDCTLMIQSAAYFRKVLATEE
jgi:sugar phosphate isomerase/epimerase